MIDREENMVSMKMNSKSSKRKIYWAGSSAILLSFFLLLMYLEHEWDNMKIDGVNKTGRTIVCKSAFDIMANNTYMIISRDGKVVVMDPYDVIPGPPPDLITVSHLHGDHYDEEYTASSNCRKSIAQVDSFATSDLKMYSIPASHYGDSVDESNPSDVIYVVEIDSLKIAHLGDYAQSRLTDKQKALLNGVDILIMPCAYYPVTDSSIDNILTELHPPVIFTTHADHKRMAFLKESVTNNIVLKERYSIDKSEIDRSSMTLVTLERDHGVLLFARFLVYKFTGSNLFKFILALAGLILIVWVLFRRRRMKKANLEKVQRTLESVTRRWWFLAIFVLINLMIPPIVSKGIDLSKTGEVLDYILRHSLFASDSLSSLYPVFKILPMALAIALVFLGNRISRYLSLYAGITYILFAVLQYVAVTDRFGFGILSGHFVLTLIVACFWFWEVAINRNDFSARKIPIIRYWVIPLAFLAFWYPLNLESMKPDFDLSYILANPAGLAFCSMTPVYLGILTLYHPSVNIATLRITSLLGVIVGFWNLLVNFLMSPVMLWWDGVLHLPLVFISVYALTLSFRKTESV